MDHTPKEVAALFKHSTDAQILTPREDLVNATIGILRTRNVVMLRAPPQAGKSTLAQLISQKIFMQHPDLEPISFHWSARRAETPNKPSYIEVLEEKYRKSVIANDAVRAKLGLHLETGTPRKPVYIIDDAHYTYSEDEMWEDQFKDGVRDKNDHFLLVCVYGAASGLHTWGPVTSQSARIPAASRIELLSQPPHHLQIRMNQQEHSEVIKRWATNTKVECDQSVYTFLWYETQGHAGVLKIMLEFIKSKAPTVFAYHGESIISYDAAQCRMILGEDFLPALVHGARGYWHKQAMADYIEAHEGKMQADPKFSWLSITDINDALFAAATQLNGAWISDYDSTKNKAGSSALKLLAAHRLGLLHSVKHEDWTQYIFASRFHQRAALAYLKPPTQGITSLLATTIDALRLFSPSALTSRTERRNHEWVIPEATFHAEMYRCLQRILPGYFIAIEWQQDQTGRVDIYLPRDRLGIELLQNETLNEIVEHVGRFDETLCGKYWKWKIIDDYLVINFCSSSKYKDMPEANPNMFSKLIHVIYDQQEQTLTVYGADHQPKCSPIILSEEDHSSSMKGGDYAAR
ncbi:MAG: hypothetical protein LQ349_000310 [Xanthoria aureola]|nr:MAG: hypothetical protein LQ349_000310 [Xanthoria aureola]